MDSVRRASKSIRTNPTFTILIVILVIGLVIRLGLVFQPLQVLLEKLLFDDAFYYYTVADNIAGGHGMVYNGVPTNGLQPLWTILLVPFFFSESAIIPIYASLVILAIVSTATGVVLFLLGREIWNERVGIAMGGLWLLSPYPVLMSLKGVGIPLQAFFVATLAWFLVARVDRTRYTDKNVVVIAALLSLIFLARQDGAWIVIAFFLTASARSWRQSRGQFPIDSRIIQIGFLSLGMVAPWLLWNILRANRLTPVAAAAIRVDRLLKGSYANWVGWAIQQTASFPRNFVTLVEMPTIFAAAVILVVYVAPILILMAIDREWLWTIGREFDYLFLGILFYYPFYIFYVLGYRPYYSVFTSLLCSIYLGLVLTRVIELVPRGRWRSPVALGVALLLVTSFVVGGIQYYDAEDKLGDTQYRTALYLEEELNSRERAAAFQSGVLEYFTPDVEVINLDGVINPEAYEARADGRLNAYLHRRGVTHLAGTRGYTSRVISENASPLRTFSDSNRPEEVIIVYHLNGTNFAPDDRTA